MQFIVVSCSKVIVVAIEPLTSPPRRIGYLLGLVPLIELLLHADLQQHFLLSEILLLRHRRVLLLATWLLLLSIFLLGELLLLRLCHLLCSQLMLGSLVGIVLFEFLHKNELLLFREVLLLSLG